MQIVNPIDVEDALRVDLAELLTETDVYAQPAPDDLAANSVCVNCLGGFPTSPVSHGYDVLIDVWGETPGAAMSLANTVAGYVASLPVRPFESGNEWKTAETNPPYNNPDPNRPRIPRCSFRATLGIRGESNF